MLPVFPSAGDTLARRILDRLRFLVDGSTQLESPTALSFLASKGNVHLARQARWNGAAWEFIVPNGGQATRLIVQDGLVSLGTAPSGANPPVWTDATIAVPPTAWTSAAGLYAANWAGFGTAGFADVQYRKNPAGQVQLMGLAKKGVALALPDTIFTLPVGFRPATTHIFVAASFAGYTEIRVNTGGAVLIQVGGSATWTATEGITFDPAT